RFAFQGLVQCACAGGDQADAQQRIQQAALHAGDAGLHRTQVKPAPSGDQNQADDLDLEKLAQVVEERSRGAGLRRMDVRRTMRGLLCRNSGLGSGSHRSVTSAKEPGWIMPKASVDDSKRGSSLREE